MYTDACMYVPTYVRMYVCMHVYMYVCDSMSVRPFVRLLRIVGPPISTFLHSPQKEDECTDACMYMYVCMYVSMHICMYIFMCICMCVCVRVCVRVCNHLDCCLYSLEAAP